MCARKWILSCSVLALSAMAFAHDISTKIIAKVANATVGVVAETKKHQFYTIGTGWLCENQSTVVTAGHVVQAMTDGEDEGKPFVKFWVKFRDNTLVEVQQLRDFKGDDVGILKIGSHREYIPLKLTPRKLTLGEPVFHVGFPFGSDNGYEWAYSSGAVSFFEDVWSTGPRFGVNTASYGGNSGSAIVDPRGNVLGVLVTGDTRADHFTGCVYASVIKEALKSATVVWPTPVSLKTLSSLNRKK